MALAGAARWVRREAHAEWQLLREIATIRLPGKALRDRLREITENGGLVLSGDLLPMVNGGPLRQARVLLQLDGDVMLLVPRDFGARADDPAQIGNLLNALSAELAALQAALPYNWAALTSVGLKTASLALTAIQAPGATQSLLGLIGHAAPGVAVQSVSWWPIAETACGVLGLAFGQPLRQGITSGMGWLLRRAIRHDA
jgi:hypothetical protein